MERKENNVVVFKSLTTKAKFIPFGLVQHAHGLKGEVLVALDSGEFLEPFPKTLYASQTSNEENNIQKLEIACLRRSHKGPIIQFQGYNERRQAESLKGLILYFDREAFQSEDFHLFEVLGFLVQLQMETALKSLGYVSHFLSHSHQDLLVVKCDGSNNAETSLKSEKYSILKNKKQVEIPFVSSYIQSIDFEKKKIILKLPKGFPGVDEHTV